MLHASRQVTACENFQRAARSTRRELLELGALWGMGLVLPGLFRAQARAGQGKGTFGRAKSVIMLYLHGGNAQQEMWDPKPDGPSPARGEFGAIATSVPGVIVSELLPRSAKIMHKLAVIRSMSHTHTDHIQASLPAMTGHHHPPSADQMGDFPPSVNDFPPFGALLDTLRPGRKLPTWVQVGPQMRRNNGTVLHGQLPGFLGACHNPLVVDQDLLPADVRVEAVTPDSEVPLLRVAGRRNLLEQVDAQRRLLDRASEVQSFDEFQQRALNLLTSPQTAKAFNLAEEPASLRDRYGRTQFGQCCLLARRLAEAGVPMINVHFCRTPAGSWDTHSKHFSQMKELLCPTFDHAFAALVEDLDERGLLDRTLVWANAEFGRTPKVNGSAGRDHWPWVYSLALAGGGMAHGIVYGASDNIAGHPITRPHDPKDLAATVYHLLGLPDDTIIYDQFKRPNQLVIGQKIDAMLI
ncbi:MAG: DUF1501 domain-containing protein [Planctomycetes bacterium]|nr:DUF1501 domain-containing protein [Planctomycetota bacterium]